MADNIFDEFKWRGLLFDHTEGAEPLLKNEKITIYNGFDPTAKSLHIGNLVPLMQLARLQRFGHTPIALGGGGTAMVGDPSGKSEERNLMTTEQIEANLVPIKQQLASILDFEVKSNPAQVVNNADWLTEVNLMEFLRDIGKHFTVNYMLAKDSVKSRIDRAGAGISFTEFTYMLLQAYDFLLLNERYNCQMQAGGSDQWGNITAGTELIRRATGQRAQAICYPLITRADGSKFGKTAGGESVWLDPEMTSPYRFYQWWFNVDDRDVVNYLKIFTWLNEAEIAELAAKVETAPQKRAAQTRLAQEVTRMIHGETAVSKSEKAADVLFGGSLDGLDASDIADIFADVPSSEVAKDALDGDGLTAVDLLASTNLAKSKGQARRDIQGGGVYLNNERVSDFSQMVTTSQAIEGKFLVLRKGRKRYHLVKLV